MQKQDCFFILDTNVDIEERKIRVVCCECVRKQQIENAWFWEGSKRGYGPYLFQCEFCKLIISKPEGK